MRGGPFRAAARRAGASRGVARARQTLEPRPDALARSSPAPAPPRPPRAFAHRPDPGAFWSFPGSFARDGGGVVAPRAAFRATAPAWDLPRDAVAGTTFPASVAGATEIVAALTDEQRASMLEALIAHRRSGGGKGEGGDGAEAGAPEAGAPEAGATNKTGATKAGMSREAIDALFDRGDVDGDQNLTRAEFNDLLTRFGRDGRFGADPLLADLSSGAGSGSAAAGSVTRDQLTRTFASHAIPFVGFGFMDNAIMIIAGEYIEMSIGATFALSTMAAAGLGNLLSDIAGVVSSSKIELVVERWLGIKAPDLTKAQLATRAARLAKTLGAIVGISVGCLLGMFPLLFFDADHDHNLRPDEDDREKNKADGDGAAATRGSEAKAKAAGGSRRDGDEKRRS